MSLLSLSPLLSSLFISYANRAAALESASATPSPESEEWKALQTTITTLQEENEKLKLEAREMAGNLDAASASQEAFHSQVSSLKEANTTQQDEIKSLRAELSEARGKYDCFTSTSSAEKAALEVRVLDLEAQRGELKEAVVEQQVKISKLERRMTDDAAPHRSPSPAWSMRSPMSHPSTPDLRAPYIQNPLPERGEPIPSPSFAQTPTSNTHKTNGPISPHPVPHPRGKRSGFPSQVTAPVKPTYGKVPTREASRTPSPARGPRLM